MSTYSPFDTGRSSSSSWQGDPARIDYIEDALEGVGSSHMSGALAATLPRTAIVANQNAALVSGTVLMVGLEIQKGQTVTNINLAIGSTSADTQTHGVVDLSTSGRVVLAKGADTTTTEWTGAAGGAVKTIALATPVVTTYTGLYYVGILVTADVAVPSLLCVTQPTAGGIINSSTPVLVGTSETGGTTGIAVGATHAALTATLNIPFIWLT